MGAPVFLLPGDGKFASDATGATLFMAADGHFYRDGLKYVVAGTWYGGAKGAIYGQNLFVRAGDGTIWRAVPTGWQQITDLSQLEPSFLAQLQQAGANEPT